MSSVAPQEEKSTKQSFDPESYRMSLGEHLEDLRWRLVFGLLGFLAAAVICLIFGEEVMSIFCQPLVSSLQKYELSPQVYFTNITDTFMVYMQISLISAAAISGPWILYQLWQFVSAGLYPTERKYVTKYMPFSIGLLISGMLFLYFLVLPITLNFLLSFSIGIPLKGPVSPKVSVPTTQAVFVPSIAGDPATPQPNQIWIDTVQKRLKIFFDAEGKGKGQIRVIPFGPHNLVAPMITLPNYIDLVLKLLILFGLTFQLPLVMIAVVKLGFVQVAQLRKWRRGAYFGIAVLCGVVVPDVVTGMIAMMIPLIILYEVGIMIAARGTPITKPEAESETESKGDDSAKDDK